MATAAPPQSLPLYQESDFACRIYLVEVESPSGDIVPLTTGPVVGFLSRYELTKDAVEANAAFVVDFEWTGDTGWWRVGINGAPLTAAALTAAFPDNECFLFAVKTGDIKGSLKLNIKDKRPMKVIP